MSQINTDTHRTAREFARETGNDALAERLERLDGRLAERRTVVATIEAIQTLADRAVTAGLDGDPAIDALEAEAATLAETYGLAAPSAGETHAATPA